MSVPYRVGPEKSLDARLNRGFVRTRSKLYRKAEDPHEHLQRVPGLSSFPSLLLFPKSLAAGLKLELSPLTSSNSSTSSARTKNHATRWQNLRSSSLSLNHRTPDSQERTPRRSQRSKDIGHYSLLVMRKKSGWGESK